jgi:hypothetical protein
MNPWVENQKRRLPDHIQEAFSRLGPSIRLVPCDEEMNVLGRGGILQASSKKEQLLAWIDKFPLCIFAVVPQVSEVDAYLYSREMIRKHLEPSKKLMDSPCIALSYAEDEHELMASDGLPVDAIKQFIYIVPGTLSTDAPQRIGKDVPVDVPNKGLIILPRKKPIPIGGQSIVVTTKSKMKARAKVEWC